jgi:hypothetical protein
MSTIEQSFDQYKAVLSDMFQNKVDPDLAMKIMYLERKLPDAEPKVELDIEVNPRADASEMAYQINSKFGFQASAHKNHLTVVGRTNVDKLAKLAAHPDIKWISGLATPASF